MLTLRLDPALEQQLEQACQRLQIGKSELVRRSLQAFLAQQQLSDPWESGEALFGRFDSGNPDLTSRRKHLIQQRLLRKHGEA